MQMQKTDAFFHSIHPAKESSCVTFAIK